MPGRHQRSRRAPFEFSRPSDYLARDPIYASPTIERFPPGPWFAGEPRPLSLPGNVLVVSAVPIPVTFASDHWSADVRLNMPEGVTSYRPFIRLAVARYQPHSLPDLELSPVVTTQLVSLMPDREIVITRTSRGLQVSIHGIGPDPANRVVAGIDQCTQDVADEATVDLIALDDNDGAFPVWQPLPDYTRTGDSSGIPIELPIPPPGRLLRLRIREIELAPGVSPPAGADDLAETLPEFTERTVLIDHIPVPAHWTQ